MTITSGPRNSNNALVAGSSGRPRSALILLWLVSLAPKTVTGLPASFSRGIRPPRPQDSPLVAQIVLGAGNQLSGHRKHERVDLDYLPIIFYAVPVRPCFMAST